MIDSLKGKRIAIVEDNVVNMAVFATTLRKSGATVIQDNFTADPAKVLGRHRQIDLILLDLMLRYNTNGYEIFDELQNDPNLQNTPVVAISSLDGETEIPKLKEKGFAGFISKPVNINKFIQQLLRVLNGEQVWVVDH